MAKYNMGYRSVVATERENHVGLGTRKSIMVAYNFSQ